MIDVLQKLKEIAESKPELVKDAVENVEKTNPGDQEKMQGLLQWFKNKYDTYRKDFINDQIENGIRGSQLEQAVENNDELVELENIIDALKSGSMKDAIEEINRAKYEFSGIPGDGDDFMQVIEKLGIPKDTFYFTKVDEGRMKDYLHDEAEKLSREEFLKKHGESLRGFYDAINGTEDDEDSIAGEGKMMKKETVKEDIQISADTPQEASMMMQILKLAGVQPVDAKMISADEPEHGSDMDPGAMNKQMDTPSDDDAMGSQEMGRMRDMMTAPDEEKAAETFANSPGDREKDEPKTMDTDTLVNTMSGGLNRQKKTHPRVSPGDNPMTAEDKITEEELANSLRSQYESFKETYQKAAETKAKPDFLDMDKDGNKKEPMKKAIKDKEAK